MKKSIACLVALTALLIAVERITAQTDATSGLVERTFSSGGQINLDLSAGDYTVRKGTSDRIRLSWQTRTAEQAHDVKVRLDVHGTEATIATDGPNNHFRVEIEIPQRSDLFLRMTAGDLTISGIEGHKDVRLRAGDLSIEVADAAQYRHVEASVTAGDLAATPFGFETGGLFRSFSHEGRGKFDLKARLWAGDLRLHPPSRPED